MDYSKYYLWIVKAGIVACLLLPLLIIKDQIFAMQVGKVLVFRSIMEIVAFFYVLLIIRKEEFRPKWGLFEVSITAYLLVYFMASVVGVNFLRSFWGTAERMGGFFTLFHLWLYFIILTSVYKTKKEWKMLFGITILVAGISSIYAIGQSAFFWRVVLPWLKVQNIDLYLLASKYVTSDNFIITDSWRSFGMVGNAGLFAGYILYNIFFSFYVLSSTKGMRKKILGLVASLVLFSALSNAGTRSAILAALAGIFVLALEYVILSTKKKVKLVSAIFLLCFISGGIFVWANRGEEWVKNSTILSRITSISLDSNESRTMTWESSWKGYLDRPILGVGPENYNIVFNKYFNPLHFTGYGSTSWYDKPHNIFLEVLTTTGLIGFASYMGIFAVIFWFLAMNRSKARENLVGFALVLSLPVAYFVQNMFWFDDFSSYLMLFMFFAFASFFFNEELKFEYNLKEGRKIVGKISDTLDLSRIGNWILDNEKIFLSVFGIILTLSIYSANVKAWRFHDLTTTAVVSFNVNSNDAFLRYKEAIDNSTYLGRQELYKRFGNYVNARYDLSGKETSKEQEIFKQNLEYAISEIENALKENDRDVQFYSLLGALYNKYYSNFRDMQYLEKAEKTLEKAVELSPERETVYYEYGQTMVFRKDYAKAIELFKRGVDLNSSVPISHWYLGMAYLNAKEYESADNEITIAIELGHPYKTVKDILNIAPIYIQLKNYDRLEQLYAEALNLDSDNPEFYVSLALVYKEKGNMIGAREMAEKAISLDASFKEEGEKFIESLK